MDHEGTRWLIVNLGCKHLRQESEMHRLRPHVSRTHRGVSLNRMAASCLGTRISCRTLNVLLSTHVILRFPCEG